MDKELEEHLNKLLGTASNSETNQDKYINKIKKNKEKAGFIYRLLLTLNGETKITAIEKGNPLIEKSSIRAYLDSLQKQTGLICFQAKPYSIDEHPTRKKNRFGNKKKYPKRLCIIPIYHIYPEKKQAYKEFLQELEKIIKQDTIKKPEGETQ